MAQFLDENFLLKNETAKRLFFHVAKDLPIFDYHCHLSPKAIAEDEPFDDIARMWLEGDHYKWRIMRANGEPESLCGGAGPWDEKFVAYARALLRAAGNPLLHWSHLELQRIFGISDVLTPQNALEIRQKANRLLAAGRISPRSLLVQFNVKVLCTTDDPVDDLHWHRTIAEEQKKGSAFQTKVLPAFRPDKALNTSDIAAWNKYVDELGRAAGVDIDAYPSLLEALAKRHDYFHSMGCRLSDHALLVPPYVPASDADLDAIVKKGRGGNSLSSVEQEKLATALLLHCARLNAQKGWTMQLHIAALRNVNPRLFRALGPDVGGDSTSDAPIVAPLASFSRSLGGRGRASKDYSLFTRSFEAQSSCDARGEFCRNIARGHGFAGSGQGAARCRMVVQRSERWYGAPPQGVCWGRAHRCVGGDADRFPLLYVVSSARILQAHPLQYSRRVGGCRRVAR